MVVTVVNGDTITYTLVVTNESNVTAQNVLVTDPVPVGTTYVPVCTTPSGVRPGMGRSLGTKGVSRGLRVDLARGDGQDATWRADLVEHEGGGLANVTIIERL